MSAAPATFTAAYPAVGYGAAPVAFGGYPMTYGAAPMAYGAISSAAPVERQVFQEQVTVPQQYTTFQTQSYMVNVPQTQMIAKQIAVPVQQMMSVPRTSFTTEQFQYQVPKQYMETQVQKVTKVRYEPIQYEEEQTIQVPKMAYETATGTRQVPVQTVEQVPYTTYQNQTVQEAITVNVPQQQTVQIPVTQTVNTVQNIQKVVEYARTPVNQYVVPGPTYAQPAQVSYGQPIMGGFAQPMVGGFGTVGTVGTIGGGFIGAPVAYGYGGFGIAK